MNFMFVKVSEYIIAGIEAIQRVWIIRGCKESVNKVVEFATRAQEKQIPLRLDQNNIIHRRIGNDKYDYF